MSLSSQNILVKEKQNISKLRKISGDKISQKYVQVQYIFVLGRGSGINQKLFVLFKSVGNIKKSLRDSKKV
jgi:hypothetical protein